MKTEEEIRKNLKDRDEHLGHLKRNRKDEDMIKLLAIQCTTLCWVLGDFNSMSKYIREYEDSIPF